MTTNPSDLCGLREAANTPEANALIEAGYVLHSVHAVSPPDSSGGVIRYVLGLPKDDTVAKKKARAKAALATRKNILSVE